MPCLKGTLYPNDCIKDWLLPLPAAWHFSPLVSVSSFFVLSVGHPQIATQALQPEKLGKASDPNPP